jgi:hypothetical protein
MLRVLDAIDFAHLPPERQTIVAILKHNANAPHCCGNLLHANLWETALHFNIDPNRAAVAPADVSPNAILDDLVTAPSSSRKRSSANNGNDTNAMVRFVPCDADSCRDRFELMENVFARVHPVTYDPFATTHKVTPDDISAVFAYLAYRNADARVCSRMYSSEESTASPSELVWFRTMGNSCSVVKLATEIMDSTWSGDISEWPLSRLWQTIQTGIRQDIFWVNEATRCVESIATRPGGQERAAINNVVMSPLAFVPHNDPAYDAHRWYWLYGYFYYNYRLGTATAHSPPHGSAHRSRAAVAERGAKKTAALLLRQCSAVPLKYLESNLAHILLGSGSVVVRDKEGNTLMKRLFGCKTIFEFVRLCGDVVRLDGRNGLSIAFNSEPDVSAVPDCAYSRFHFLCSLCYRAPEASLPRMPF